VAFGVSLWGVLRYLGNRELLFQWGVSLFLFDHLKQIAW